MKLAISLLCLCVSTVAVQAENSFYPSSAIEDFKVPARAWVELHTIACPTTIAAEQCFLIHGAGGYTIVPLIDSYAWQGKIPAAAHVAANFLYTHLKIDGETVESYS